MLAEEEENDAGGAAEVQGPAAAGGRNRDAVACCGSWRRLLGARAGDSVRA